MTNEESTSEESISQEDQQEKRYALVQKIMGKETFIEPLNAEAIIKSYAVYENKPEKIVEVLIDNFKLYCRKCIKEAALIEVKDEISQATVNGAEVLKTKVVDKINNAVKDDPVLEQLIVMLIFKNRFWEWVRFGLKEILNEQRAQRGHEINTILNARFHKEKKNKEIKIVGDLVTSDVTEIVNKFKGEVMKKTIKLF